MNPITLDNIANETWYLFGDTDFTDLTNQYKIIDLALDYDPILAFGLASNNSGVPFHMHGPGYSQVLVGLKRWFLFDINKEPKFDSSNIHYNGLMNYILH